MFHTLSTRNVTPSFRSFSGESCIGKGSHALQSLGCNYYFIEDDSIVENALRDEQFECYKDKVFLQYLDSISMIIHFR